MNLDLSTTADFIALSTVIFNLMLFIIQMLYNKRIKEFDEKHKQIKEYSENSFKLTIDMCELTLAAISASNFNIRAKIEKRKDLFNKISCYGLLKEKESKIFKYFDDIIMSEFCKYISEKILLNQKFNKECLDGLFYIKKSRIERLDGEIPTPKDFFKILEKTRIDDNYIYEFVLDYEEYEKYKVLRRPNMDLYNYLMIDLTYGIKGKE